MWAFFYYGDLESFAEFEAASEGIEWGAMWVAAFRPAGAG